MVELPQEYIFDKIYTYSTDVREQNSFINGCCPVCREGKSWGEKRRMFYFPDEDYFYCHNCNRGWSSYWWIREVTGLTFKQIKKELLEYDYDPKFKLIVDGIEEKTFELPSLPGECVNLMDELQMKYFSSYKAVSVAKRYCEKRRLFSALNSPKTFYCCLNDKFHGNRLIIPFFNNTGKIESYISRKIMDSDTKAKYLMKFGNNKPIFNLHKVDPEYPYIFIFEGQIDSMFVKNGIAVAGVILTDEQDEILSHQYPFHNRIWVLDNYRFEKQEVLDSIKKKLKNNERLFFYPNDFSEYKDLNEYCVKKGLDFVDPDLILNGSYKGDAGIMRLGD